MDGSRGQGVHGVWGQRPEDPYPSTFRPAQRAHHRDAPGCSHQAKHRMGHRWPLWTAAGRVGSRQQALQPSSQSGSQRLGPLREEGGTTCLVGLRQAEPRGPLIPAQWRESLPAFPGPAKGHFVHSSLLPQEGAVIYSPSARQANDGASPHPHLTPPRPGSHTSTSAPLLPSGAWGEGRRSPEAWPEAEVSQCLHTPPLPS